MARRKTGRRSDRNANRGNGANLGFESMLWAAADKLRGHMDAAEYKHVVLGLIFLKYVSDAFQEKYDDLKTRQDIDYTDPEDRDGPTATNSFWVPPDARWLYLLNNAAAFGSISKKEFRRIGWPAPPGALIPRFDRFACPNDERIGAIEQEPQTLSATRDALLPKLLSGEIRVGEAKKTIEEVA